DLLILLSSHSFFFDVPCTTATSTLSLHDALPIYGGEIDLSELLDLGTRLGERLLPGRHVGGRLEPGEHLVEVEPTADEAAWEQSDRKSTRLNSSHVAISYAVFCLKKKKTTLCEYT